MGISKSSLFFSLATKFKFKSHNVQENKMSTGRCHIIPKQKLNLVVTHIVNAPGVGKSLTSLPHTRPHCEHTLVSKSAQTEY